MYSDVYNNTYVKIWIWLVNFAHTSKNMFILLSELYYDAWMLCHNDLIKQRSDDSEYN